MNKPYVFKEFPKWKYKGDDSGKLTQRLVHSKAHEDKLGEEWHPTPKAALGKETYEAVETFEEFDESPEAEDAELEPQPNGIVRKRGRPAKA